MRPICRTVNSECHVPQSCGMSIGKQITRVQNGDYRACSSLDQVSVQFLAEEWVVPRQNSVRPEFSMI